MPRSLGTAIADALNAERIVAGLSFADLSERSGITERSLLRYLSSGTERRSLDVDQFAAICDALGLEVSDVIAMAEARMRRKTDKIADKIASETRAARPRKPPGRVADSETG